MDRFEKMGFTPEPGHEGSRWIDDAGDTYSRRYMDEIYNATGGNRFLIQMSTEMAEAEGEPYREFIKGDTWLEIASALIGGSSTELHDMIAWLYDNGWMEGNDRDEIVEGDTP